MKIPVVNNLSADLEDCVGALDLKDHESRLLAEAFVAGMKVDLDACVFIGDAVPVVTMVSLNFSAKPEPHIESESMTTERVPLPEPPEYTVELVKKDGTTEGSLRGWDDWSGAASYGERRVSVDPDVTGFRVHRLGNRLPVNPEVKECPWVLIESDEIPGQRGVASLSNLRSNLSMVGIVDRDGEKLCDMRKADAIRGIVEKDKYPDLVAVLTPAPWIEVVRAIEYLMRHHAEQKREYRSTLDLQSWLSNVAGPEWGRLPDWVKDQLRKAGM